MALSTDVCDQITQAIIRELETGVLPWSKPWDGRSGPAIPRRHNGQRYRGINILALWIAAEKRGFSSPFWMTFKQALEYGAAVRRGEKGTQIIYASKVQRMEQNEAGEDVTRAFSFLKAYTVFNAEQIDGLPAKFAPAQVPSAPEGRDWTGYANAEAWFDAIPAEVGHGGGRSFYMPSQDRIQLPERESFYKPEGYFATRAHETIHWTRHESRLNRSFGQARFGDAGYAMEELVAELGAAFTMAEIGLAPQIRDDHAPYIANWIQVLKRDNKALLTAAAKASDALEYLTGFHIAALEEAA